MVIFYFKGNLTVTSIVKVEPPAIPFDYGENNRFRLDLASLPLLCAVAPSQSYAIGINPAPDFQTTGGRSAKSIVLRFTTTGDVTRDLHTALTQAGLTDDDEPIMSGDDPGKGVSQAEPSSPAADTQPVMDGGGRKGHHGWSRRHRKAG